MSTKKRVYDLAKEYGMTGQDLAKKLQGMGFSQIKGHMTALDDFQVLQIQGMLEAHGLIPESRGAAPESGGGLVLRKKKKKVGLGGAEPEVEEKHEESHAPAVSAAPSARVEAPPAEAPAPAVRETATAAHEPRTRPAPSIPAPSAPAAVTPSRVPPIELEPLTADDAGPAPELGLDEPPRIAAEAAPAAPVAHAPVEARAPVREAPAAPATPPAIPGRGEPPVRIAMQPPSPASAQPKRLGKVVGFIDLSKIKTVVKKPQESRRLRSKDDVAPNVQPTLGHDKKRALLRGDRGTRGTMSAGQLREREAGRFLRRRGPTPGGPGGPGGGPSRGPRPMQRGGAESPHTGGRISVDPPVTVKKLAEKLAVKTSDVLKIAFQQLGFGAVNINSLLDEETATLLAGEFGVEIDIVKQVAAEEALISDLKKKRTTVEGENLVLRPPTVAFLGHVDHGKTTLIDTIRASRVAEGEAGGITQHIGAYRVTTQAGHALTIIDTPGHAAFTQMRARGAKAVDIVVLVVAADDGPMPSTEEALAHARAAKVPLVVALTKMDKVDANPQRSMEALSRLGLIPEEWGGDTAMIKVSALKAQGVEELLERVFLESEVLELKCHPAGPAQGIVLEAEISEGKGIVAHLLIQDGTLKRGDVILAGEGYGKVRSMHDDRNKVVEAAPPSMPVEVSGLSALPSVGETFYVVDDLARAKEVAAERERSNRATSLSERRTVTAESLMTAVAEQKRQSINLIVRADVQGSVEVLRNSLSELKHEEVEVRVLFAGVGAVTENDVNLASTSNAIVIAFHVGINDKARIAADRFGVEIRYFEVIYELLDQMRDQMEGALSPQVSEEITGHVEIRALFKSSKVGTIAGSHVIDGTIVRDSKLRLIRGGKVIHTGQLASLRREKDDVKEVREGFDCGIVLKDFPEVEVGDVVEAFKMVKTKRTLAT